MLVVETDRALRSDLIKADIDINVDIYINVDYLRQLAKMLLHYNLKRMVKCELCRKVGFHYISEWYRKKSLVKHEKVRYIKCAILSCRMTK